MIRKIKRKKWDRINIRTSEEKRRGFKIHNQETKKYLGIEYDLISLESYSERRWVALESNFKFPKGLILVLKRHFSFRDDFLMWFKIACKCILWRSKKIFFSDINNASNYTRKLGIK